MRGFILRAVGAAEVLRGDLGQHSRDRCPRLAKHRDTVATERPRSHWNGQYYQSLLPVPSDSLAPYDPNIDIVEAAIYGTVPVTDTKLLATAAQLRSQWADPASPDYYPINRAGQQRGIGPMLGRYPGDTYDGDTAGPPTRDHPRAFQLPSSRSSTTNWRSRSASAQRFRSTAGRQPSSARSESTPRRPRPLPPRRCRAPVTRCCRRSSSTTTISS